MKFMAGVLALLLVTFSSHAQDKPEAPVLDPNGTTVVVWNQHNGPFNDRGTKRINVALITDKKEVFRQNDIDIPWEPGKDTFVVVKVPTVRTDSVRVEIVDAVDNQGGLAEIQFFRYGKNLARKRKVTVNGFWEQNPRCAAEMLTDTITTSHEHLVGYWLPPTKEKGWAEVRLMTSN